MIRWKALSTEVFPPWYRAQKWCSFGARDPDASVNENTHCAWDTIAFYKCRDYKQINTKLRWKTQAYFSLRDWSATTFFPAGVFKTKRVRLRFCQHLLKFIVQQGKYFPFESWCVPTYWKYLHNNTEFTALKLHMPSTHSLKSNRNHEWNDIAHLQCKAPKLWPCRRKHIVLHCKHICLSAVYGTLVVLININDEDTCRDTIEKAQQSVPANNSDFIVLHKFSFAINLLKKLHRQYKGDMFASTIKVSEINMFATFHTCQSTS